MTTHLSAGGLVEDADGWLNPLCTCGWSFGPVPDMETAVDVLMEHAASVAVFEAAVAFASSDVIRPGPDSIEPNLCPGGVVVHAYSLSGRLLIEERLGPGVDVEAHAVAAADAAAGKVGPNQGLVLVMFDGDDGQRMIPPGYASGQQL